MELHQFTDNMLLWKANYVPAFKSFPIENWHTEIRLQPLRFWMLWPEKCLISFQTLHGPWAEILRQRLSCLHVMLRQPNYNPRCPRQADYNSKVSLFYWLLPGKHMTQWTADKAIPAIFKCEAPHGPGSSLRAKFTANAWCRFMVNGFVAFSFLMLCTAQSRLWSNKTNKTKSTVTRLCYCTG